MRRMIRRPIHPGNIIKEDYLLPLSITIKDMAAYYRCFKENIV